MPVPGHLQTVQRAEFWGTIMALQAYWPGHLGVDNLNVVRSIARVLDRGTFSTPLPLVKNGDIIATVQHMIAGWSETVRSAKVKGHATGLLLSKVGCGRMINLVMLGLILLLI